MTDLAPYRTAYELGRLRRALVECCALAVPLLAARAIGHPVSPLVAVALAALFGAMRWSGGPWSRAAVVGVVAGSIPFLVPVGLVLAARVECPPYCEPICAAAGFVSGLAIATVAAHSGKVLAAGGLLAALVGVLGCAPFGGTTVMGMIVAVALGVGIGRMRLVAA
jgi:hypothetical protein